MNPAAAYAFVVDDSAKVARTTTEIIEEKTSCRLIVCFHNAN
jgi:hypothetical protein